MSAISMANAMKGYEWTKHGSIKCKGSNWIRRKSWEYVDPCEECNMHQLSGVLSRYTCSGCPIWHISYKTPAWRPELYRLDHIEKDRDMIFRYLAGYCDSLGDEDLRRLRAPFFHL